MDRRDLEKESVEKLAQRLEQPLSSGEEDDFGYDDIAWALSKRGRLGLDVLARYLVAPAEHTVRAAILGISLSLGGPEKYEARLVGLLEDARDGVVKEAIRALGHGRLLSSRARIEALAGHASQHVRGAVLDYFAEVDPDEGYERAIAALRDPDIQVRECAVDLLDDLGRPEAIAALEALVDDPAPDVRAAVQSALENLRSVTGPSTSW
jgi:HEAT repeat protein